MDENRLNDMLNNICNNDGTTTQYLRDSMLNGSYPALVQRARFRIQIISIKKNKVFGDIAVKIKYGFSDIESGEWLTEYTQKILYEGDSLTFNSPLIAIDPRKLVELR